MTALSARERGDMAEELLPIAARLAVLVHGEGGPEDVQEVLHGLDNRERTALIVVLAGLVDPDQPMGRALGWLDFNEHGQTVVPVWGSNATVRDMAPEPELEDDDDYVDPTAVKNYVLGLSTDVTPRERLEAVVKGVRRGMNYPDFDRIHGLTKGSTSTFISRTRRAYELRGEEFPDMDRPDTVQLTEEQVLAIRHRFAKGRVTEIELAMSYGVSRSTISNVLTGDSHRHIGGPLRPKRKNQPGRATRVVWNGSAGEFNDISKNTDKEIAA